MKALRDPHGPTRKRSYFLHNAQHEHYFHHFLEKKNMHSINWINKKIETLLTWNSWTPRTPYARGRADSTNGKRSCISGGSTAFGSVKYLTTSGGSLFICFMKKCNEQVYIEQSILCYLVKWSKRHEKCKESTTIIITQNNNVKGYKQLAIPGMQFLAPQKNL